MLITSSKSHKRQLLSGHTQKIYYGPWRVQYLKSPQQSWTVRLLSLKMIQHKSKNLTLIKRPHIYIKYSESSMLLIRDSQQLQYPARVRKVSIIGLTPALDCPHPSTSLALITPTLPTSKCHQYSQCSIKWLRVSLCCLRWNVNSRKVKCKTSSWFRCDRPQNS